MTLASVGDIVSLPRRFSTPFNPLVGTPRFQGFGGYTGATNTVP